MAERNTVARPYAKAVFEYALAHQAIAEWSVILAHLAEIVANPLAENFIRNPSAEPVTQCELILSVLSALYSLKEKKAVEHFVSILAENRRLMVLTNICDQFNHLRAEYDKTLSV